jgi:hypothetical protein
VAEEEEATNILLLLLLVEKDSVPLRGVPTASAHYHHHHHHHHLRGVPILTLRLTAKVRGNSTWRRRRGGW